MTELSFAKSFLSTLDPRPLKLPADHIADPKSFTPKGAYTLPRMPTPMTPHPPPSDPNPAALRSRAHNNDDTVTVVLKSLKNPPLELRLPAQGLATSVLDLKGAVAEAVGLDGVGKVRILHRKKPCADSKSVKDVLVGDEAGERTGEVEFGVMVIGGVPEAGGAKKGGEMDVDAPSTTAAAAAAVAQGKSGEEVLGGEEFWEDLRGWLSQRVRDEGTAGRAFEVFRGAWGGR